MSQSVRKKREKRKDTRDRLIKEGIELIYKNGYSQTKISDITKKAGVAHGTFYVYFASKEKFFMEILKMSRKDLVSNAENGIALAKEGKIEEGKTLFFDKGFDLLIEKAPLFSVLFFDAMCFDESFKEFYKEGVILFIDKIKEMLDTINIDRSLEKAHMIKGLAKNLLEIYIYTGEKRKDLWKNSLNILGINI